jgi:hypothetical protein
VNAGVDLQAPVEVDAGPHLESDCQRGCTPFCVTNDNVQCKTNIKEPAFCLGNQNKSNVLISYIVIPSELTAHPPWQKVHLSPNKP